MKSLYDALQLPGPLDTEPETTEPDLCDLTGIEFSKGVVNSRIYRQSIVNRVLSQTLPPAVECRLLDHAWGKPTERIEHAGKVEITRVESVIIDSGIGDSYVAH